MPVYDYSRVSTPEQRHDLQHDDFRRRGVPEKNIYSDTISGASDAASRPAFEQLLTLLRPGGELIVWKLDRLGHSMVDCVNTVDRLHRSGIRIVVTKDGLDSGTDIGRAMMGFLAVLAEIERSTTQTRVKSGMEAAAKRGTHCGRPKAVTEATALVVRDYLARGAKVPEIARALEMSRMTVYRCMHLLKTIEAEQQKTIPEVAGTMADLCGTEAWPKNAD